MNYWGGGGRGCGGCGGLKPNKLLGGLNPIRLVNQCNELGGDLQEQLQIRNMIVYDRKYSPFPRNKDHPNMYNAAKFFLDQDSGGNRGKSWSHFPEKSLQAQVLTILGETTNR